MQPYLVNTDNGVVRCYGTLEDASNISVLCDHEDDDGIWLGGNLTTDKPFTTWEEAVDHLQQYYASIIVELTV